MYILILISLLLMYTIVSPFFIDYVEQPNATVENCVDGGFEEQLDLSSNGNIRFKSGEESVTVSVPSKVSTSLHFSSTVDFRVIESKNMSSSEYGKYSSDEGENSTLKYKTNSIGKTRINISKNDNYIVLPKLESGSYKLSTKRNVFGTLVHIGRDFNYQTVQIGCQNIEYYSNGSFNTHEGVLRRTVDNIPFKNNYTNIKVVKTDNINDIEELESVGGYARENLIRIKNNTRHNFVHEYVHTRQDDATWRLNRDRPWFVEGSAEYYALKSLYKSGFYSLPEYKTQIYKRWKSRGNMTSKDLYNSDSTFEGHYQFGPKVFYEYENGVGNISIRDAKEPTIGEYYKNYNNSNSIYNSPINKYLSIFITSYRMPISILGFILWFLPPILTRIFVKRRTFNELLYSEKTRGIS